MKIYSRPSIKNKNPWVTIILIIVLFTTLTITRMYKRSKGNSSPTNTLGTYANHDINRNPSVINYSKHARCRMDCRHIDESEVREILQTGKINYNKSELDEPNCKRKYALEGTTHDSQRVRIIFAPCNTEVTVVTVIDIGQEWSCDCK